MLLASPGSPRQSGRVPAEPVTLSFDEWFAALVPQPGLRDDLRLWFRALYDDQGPIAKDLAITACELDVLTVVEWALPQVLADLQRTSELRPEVRFDNYGNGVRITVDGNYSEPSLHAGPEVQSVLHEIADYIQDCVMSAHLRVWPTCPTHPAGLHADLVDGVACWCCRLGGHVVAKVGELETRPPKDA